MYFPILILFLFIATGTAAALGIWERVLNSVALSDYYIKNQANSVDNKNLQYENLQSSNLQTNPESPIPNNILNNDGNNIQTNGMVSFKYQMQMITFNSQGSKIVGWAFIPVNSSGNSVMRPAVVIIGPGFYIKEQSPMQYATKLASMGFIALVFDPRGRGESEGLPRGLESPLMKKQDLMASIDFLEQFPGVKTNAIFAVGICMGASVVLDTAAEDKRIKAIATVAGFYATQESLMNLVNGKEQWTIRVQRGDDAKKRYETSKKIWDWDYLPIVDPGRKDVAFPQKNIWDWYKGWIGNTNSGGTWKNSYHVMSDAELMRWDVMQSVNKLTTPWLMIHSDQSPSPNVARKVFKDSISQEKVSEWIPNVQQTWFYDKPWLIDYVSQKIYAFYMVFLK